MFDFNDFSNDWRASEESVASAAKAYVKERRAFDERGRQIAAGAVFPAIHDLVEGQPPFRDSLIADVETFVARSRSSLDVRDSLRSDLHDFGVWPSCDGAIRIFDGVTLVNGDDGLASVEVGPIRYRAAWYAAVFGSVRMRNWLHGAFRSVDPRRTAYLLGLLDTRISFGSAGDWKSGTQLEISTEGVYWMRHVAQVVDCADWMSANDEIVRRFTRGKAQRSELFALANPVAAATPPAPTNPHPAFPTEEEYRESQRKSEEKAVEAEASQTIADMLGQPKLAVIPKIEVAGTSEHKTFMGQFAKLSLLRVPLVVAPDVGAIGRELEGMWPHAAAVIRRLLSDVVPGQPVRLRPTILVGDPGSGKTRLLNALARRLGLASVTFPCASVADGSFGGTPAQWSTRRASVPLELIRSSRTANPAIILDELEKTGSSNHNGSLLHALLPMLERHSSEAYFETALETNVNLSAVSFLATANSLVGIPDPLRDRFRVVQMPNPGLEHLDSLVDGIAMDVLDERGVPAPFHELLAPDEVEVVGHAWGGGSLRKLRMAVEAAIDHRDRSRTMQ